MKSRSFFSILLGVVLTVLLLGVGGFAWLLSDNPLTLLSGSRLTSPTAAMFVPKQAPFMASLLVNPDRLESFRAVVAPAGRRRQARQEIQRYQQRLLANTGLEYQRDIQPWLGSEVTLAIATLDIDRDLSNGRQPGYLLAVATQDSPRSREFLQLFWQKRALNGADLVFEQYKGVKLIYDSGASGLKTTANSAPLAALATAVVGDRYVLFANDPKVLRDAITNVQSPGLSLKDSATYQRTLDTLNQPRIGLTFANVPALADWLATSSTTAPTKSTPKLESANAQTAAIALGLSRNGLLAETAIRSESPTGKTQVPTLKGPVEALAYLPLGVPLAASGTDLAQVWTGISRTLGQNNPVSSLVESALQNLSDRWQIDLPQDVFAWVQGEYALGTLPTGGAPAQARVSANSDWVFVAQRSPQAAAAIARLDDLARQQGLSVGALELDHRTVSAWTRLRVTGNGRQPRNLQATVAGVHTTIKNYELFATSLTAMERALQSIEVPLLKDPDFQRAIAPVPQPNNGYLYVDWAASQPLLEQQFPVLKVVELAGQPLFNHLQSLTLTSYGQQNGIQRGGIFVRLS